MRKKSTDALALLALVPVPSLAVVTAMWLAPGTVGGFVWAAAKVWIAVLPLVWWRYVDRRAWSWSPPRNGGLLVGLASGAAIAAGILAFYAIAGPSLIDPDSVRANVVATGLDSPPRYLAIAAYLILINSLIEEYVWRWFVFTKCEGLTGRGRAVFLAALFFTLHHILILFAQFGGTAAAIGSAGVFVGGLIWSWCYRRYRSIWPGYLSHLLADVAVLGIGWRLIF